MFRSSQSKKYGLPKESCITYVTNKVGNRNNILTHEITVQRSLQFPIDNIFCCAGRIAILTYIKEIEFVLAKLNKKKGWLLLSAYSRQRYLTRLLNQINKPLAKVETDNVCSATCWGAFKQDEEKIKLMSYRMIKDSQIEYTANQFLENSLGFVKLLQCNQEDSIINCNNYKQHYKSNQQYNKEIKFNQAREKGVCRPLSRYQKLEGNCKGIIKGYLLFSEIQFILQIISNIAHPWNDLDYTQKKMRVKTIFDYCNVLIFKWQVSSNCVTCQQWSQKTYFAYVTRLEEEFENLVEKGEGGFQNFLIAVKKTESQFYTSVIARRDCQAYKQYYE